MNLFSILKKLKKNIKAYQFESDYYYQVSSGSEKSHPQIVYLLHTDNHKAGGDKVIYHQSQLISKMSFLGMRSKILHPKDTKFQQTWFIHQAEFKTDLVFDPATEFVVVPEIWAAPHGNMLNKLGIKYAIFVQNGYSINIPLYSYTRQELNEAYEKASLILSISDDTTACINMAFPTLSTEILRINCSVDQEKFKPAINKENIITYMPRKLSHHSKMLLFFLEENLLKNWKIQAIDGLSESGVREVLSRSRLFLSFSEFEGFGLPPVEAALSGNFVIGYTGEAAKEYWDLPLFTEVACGDIKTFVKQILSKIAYLDQHDQLEEDEMLRLSTRYSAENEKKSLERFINKVQHILGK